MLIPVPPTCVLQDPYFSKRQKHAYPCPAHMRPTGPILFKEAKTCLSLSRPRGFYRTHTFQRGKNMLSPVPTTWVLQDPYFSKRQKHAYPCPDHVGSTSTGPILFKEAKTCLKVKYPVPPTWVPQDPYFLHSESLEALFICFLFHQL